MTPTLPTTAQMLASIGWAEVGPDANGNAYAEDVDNGAVRISNGWGSTWAPDGFWSCGSRGPRGRWPTFDAAVEAAYRHHRLGEPEEPLPKPVTPDTPTPAEVARLRGIEVAARRFLGASWSDAPASGRDDADRRHRTASDLSAALAGQAPPDPRDERIRVLEEALDATMQVAFDGPRETKGTGHESVNDWRARVEKMARAALGSPS